MISKITVLLVVIAVVRRGHATEVTTGDKVTHGDPSGEITTVNGSPVHKIIENGSALKRATRDVGKSSDGGCNEGSEVSEFQFRKFYSFIVAMYDFNGDYRCVGTILTARLILTTRHCTDPRDHMYYIRANSRDSFSGGETHMIERFFTRFTGEMNDIALVLLKTRIERHVSVTFLRPDAFVHSGTEVVTFGWGEADYNTWPRYLRMVTMNITDASKCRKEYPGTSWICTGEKNLSNCVISPGSPTHINGWLMGIVSLGGNKSQSRTPIANVNLRKYWKWIESYMKDQQYA